MAVVTSGFRNNSLKKRLIFLFFNEKRKKPYLET